jgi:S-adenosylmethionine:tRNA ribosyltransferase-isomerase
MAGGGGSGHHPDLHVPPPTMKRSDFHFDLPPALIAQAPLPGRSDARLLVLPADGGPHDRAIADLPGLLRAGDLLVLNDTRVLPARLQARKRTGGAAEILIERLLGGHEVKAQLGVSKKPRPGDHLELEDGSAVEVLGRDEGFFHLRFADDQPLAQRLERLGHMPLPPYITRPDDAADALRYQTVFAREPGAVAAPTAGLHFDQPLLDAIAAGGVDIGQVTLHVGAGTFQPVRVDDVREHRMHSEWINVGAALCAQIRRTRERGGRVVAVGTTVVRALESARGGGDAILPYAGETAIFIYPGYRFASADLLLTNFHLPESTLLMLVSAFAGRDRVLAAYRHAVQARYRFFSYGDAMLVAHVPGAGCAGADGRDPSPGPGP